MKRRNARQIDGGGAVARPGEAFAVRIHDARFETADRDTVRAFQLERLKALVAKTWATNDFYRAHWTKARPGA